MLALPFAWYHLQERWERHALAAEVLRPKLQLQSRHIALQSCGGAALRCLRKTLFWREQKKGTRAPAVWLSKMHIQAHTRTLLLHIPLNFFWASRLISQAKPSKSATRSYRPGRQYFLLKSCAADLIAVGKQARWKNAEWSIAAIVQSTTNIVSRCMVTQKLCMEY